MTLAVIFEYPASRFGYWYFHENGLFLKKNSQILAENFQERAKTSLSKTVNREGNVHRICIPWISGAMPWLPW